MTADDIDPVSEAILAADWGDRRAWFRFAVGHTGCHVVVAEGDDGTILGTGVTTVNGPVAWIGTIWVAPAARGQGLGLSLTRATMDAAEAAGCRSLVLVATRQGQPLYERLGFRVQTWYRTMEAPGLRSADAPPARGARRPLGVRPGAATDLDAMAALDRGATGEDRAHLLRAFADPAATNVVVDGAGDLCGFLVRPPWGGGATVATDPDVAMALLRARRLASGPDRRVRCGILAENEAGAAVLAADGWTEAWRAPRLVHGVEPDWRPERIWGQFNHALG